MSLAIWGFETRTNHEVAEEARRARVARAQMKVLRKQRRRDLRIRMTRWMGRHKMAVYPVGAVGSFSAGFFTWGLLPGFIVLGLGLLMLEWRFSR